MTGRAPGPSLSPVPARVLIAGGRSAITELRAANGEINVVGHVRSLEDAENALRTLRPSVLVIDAALTHKEGLCFLGALRRASPGTAIVIPPAGEPGPRLVRAIELAARDCPRRREDDGLTPRERDVVGLVALGHTNREIAERLVLSVRTVETHRARIQRRLGCHSRAQLVRWALEHDLLSH